MEASSESLNSRRVCSFLTPRSRIPRYVAEDERTIVCVYTMCDLKEVRKHVSVLPPCLPWSLVPRSHGEAAAACLPPCTSSHLLAPPPSLFPPSTSLFPPSIPCQRGPDDLDNLMTPVNFDLRQLPFRQSLAPLVCHAHGHCIALRVMIWNASHPPVTLPSSDYGTQFHLSRLTSGSASPLPKQPSNRVAPIHSICAPRPHNSSLVETFLVESGHLTVVRHRQWYRTPVHRVPVQISKAES